MAATNTSLLRTALSNLHNISNAENAWLMEGQVHRHHARRYCVSDALLWLKDYVYEFNDIVQTLERAKNYAMSCRSDHVLATKFIKIKNRLIISFTDGSKAVLTANGPFLQACWQRRSGRSLYVYGTFKTVHRRYINVNRDCASLVRIF